MKKVELVFIPSPGAGHLVSAVEFSKRLIARDARLSITILTINSPFQAPAHQNKPTAFQEENPSEPRFVSLPQVEPPPKEVLQESIEEYISAFVASLSHHVRNEIITLQKNSENPVILVLDMFCTSMIDVADELGLLAYVFFTSGAAFLGHLLHLRDRYNRTNVPKFDESEPKIMIPTFQNPVPSAALPNFAYNKAGYTAFMNHGSKFKQTKGVIINTFAELEPYAIKSLAETYQNLPVYTVGPVLDLKGQAHKPSDQDQRARIMNWLDDQPDESVVFLCFGSVGSFNEDQVKEIAAGLSQSGQGFIWSLRKQTTSGAKRPTEYTEMELKSVLPGDFWALVEEGRGLVCGWAPQVEILAHKGVGAFVSHCGWNSTLESLWFGKPIVAWPLYAEQRGNAFELVSELGLANTWLGCGNKPSDLVTANEVEEAIRLVMDKDNPVRSKVKKMSEVSKHALMDGGSSFNSTSCFIRSIFGEEL